MGKPKNVEYLDNGWSQSEKDENLGLRVLHVQCTYVGYFGCPNA